MRPKFIRNSHAFTALLWMLVGTTVIFAVVLLMNRPVEKKEEKNAPAATMVEVKKEQKKKKQKIERPPQQKKAAPSRAAVAPLPTISSSLSGADFGIPQFQIAAGLTGAANDKLLGDMSNIVMTDEAVDEPPRPASRVAMEYPQRARAKGITGHVLFNLLISVTGEVETAQILESVPTGVFDEAALASIRQWKFEPALYKGKSVKVWAKQKISFNLN
jgi:protein TonB